MNWMKAAAISAAAALGPLPLQAQTPLDPHRPPDAAIVEYRGTAGAIEAYYGRPSEVRAAVIYFHGLVVEQAGREAAAQKGYDVRAFVEGLEQAGFAALAPLRDRDQKNSPREILEASLDYLVRHAGELPVGLIGFSKGAALALTASAGSPRIDALVLLSPGIEDVKEAALPGCPVFLSAGTADQAGLRRNAALLAERLRAAGIEVVFRDDYPGDHQWFWRPRPEYWADVIAFLHARLAAQCRGVLCSK